MKYLGVSFSDRHILVVREKKKTRKRAYKNEAENIKMEE